MGFKQLITKVEQAEAALEEKERHASAQWRQLKSEWIAAWTPGRIVIAGLVSGFFVGRAQPVKAAAKSGQMMQMITMLSGLFAGGTAKVAADEAEQAAQNAAHAADAVDAAPAVAHPQARDPLAGRVAPGDAVTPEGVPASAAADRTVTDRTVEVPRPAPEDAAPGPQRGPR